MCIRDRFSVVVVSTIIPKLAAYVVLFAKPVMVTVELPTVPLVMVATPDPLEVRLLLRALIDIRVPAPLLTSGLALGKDVSLAIGTKPPTSSTKSIILSLIAAVVAIVVSLSGNVSPSLIVSPVLILKNLASAAAEVKNDVSLVVADPCSDAVITVAPFNLSEVIDPAA